MNDNLMREAPEAPKKPEPAEPEVAQPEKLPEGTTEVTLYTDKGGPEPNHPIHIIFYFYAHFFNWVSFKLMLGIIFLVISSQDTNLLFLFPALYLGYHLIRLTNVIQFRARHLQNFQDLTHDTSYDIGYSLGLMLCALGMLLYLLNEIEPAYLWCFTVPHVIVSFISFIKFRNAPLLITSPFYAFIESIQILVIFTHVGKVMEPYQWENQFVLYYYVYLLLLILGYVIAALWIVTFFVFLCRIRDLRADEIATFIMVLVIGLFLAVELILSRHILSFFIDLASSNSLTPTSSPLTLPIQTHSLGMTLVIFYAIFAAVIMLFLPFLISNRMNAFSNQRIKSISLMSFPQMINSGYNQVSGTFFKKEGGGAEGANGQVENETCSICITNPSNVIMQPCGHGGYCQECITEWIKNKNECPLCKLKINQILLVEVDPQTKKVMTKGIIKIT